MSQDTWDERWIGLAKEVASWSKDRSTKCSAIIVGPDNEIRSLGYNGFVRGADDGVEADHERPRKYALTEHGERNCILNAARANIPIKGCKMYLNFGASPCADCARAIIQSGIVEVIGNADEPFPGKGDQWAESCKASFYMFAQAKVAVRNYSFKEKRNV